MIGLKDALLSLKSPMSAPKLKGKVEEDFKEVLKDWEQTNSQSKDERTDIVSLIGQLHALAGNMGKESDAGRKAFESRVLNR